MKPLSLEFCGINSFSEPACVDFAKLSEFGLFGVFGDTGSGKSTILDCVGFALYGNVSRARSGSVAEIINYGCDKAYVNFEFEIYTEGRRRIYRVERELKKKNAVQSVKVYEREGESLRALSEGVRESNALLERIVGLEQKDFEKCIALPQGEFAQFVKAPRSDRLKLVSRLFDLEEYGEQLVKKANARCARLEGERNLLRARLEPYEGYSRDGISALRDEVAHLSGRETETTDELEKAKAEELLLAEQFRKKRELEAAEARLNILEARKGEIEFLERELGRLELARRASEAAKEEETARKRAARAESERETAEAEIGRAKRAEAEFEDFDFDRADEELAEYTERKARAEQAEEREKRKKEFETRLQSARLAYSEEAERFQGFSYEAEKEAIEGRLAELKKDENFVAFVQTHGKAALLRGEYAVFAQELNSIVEKFPETRNFVSPIAEKYVALSAGGGEDLTQIARAYETREKDRKAEREKLVLLEKKNGLYRAHRERLMQLQTEGVRLKEELSSLASVRETEVLSRGELERTLETLKNRKKSALSAREKAAKELAAAAEKFAAARERANAAKANAEAAAEKARESLSRGGFGSAEEAEALLSRLGGSDAEERARRFREEYAALKSKAAELCGIDREITSERVAAARERRVGLEREREEILKSLALKRDELSRSEEALGKKEGLEKELSSCEGKAELAERLKKLLEGNKFMEFVAEEYLQNISESGSKRLLNLTGGRYFLRYEGGFLVGDNLSGGNLRSVSTLSGGETFLVSLSLALALSAEICLKSLRPIEFFFLDEGFGTLDAKLVDVVMDSLEKLKGEHFSIGVISHVEELKHRIERKLLVEKATEEHGSRIEMN